MTRLSCRASAAALSVVFGLLAASVRADITLERSMSFEGVGALAMGNLSGTTRTSISGQKSRMDSDMKMQSKLVSFLARGAAGPSAEIVRLDEDKIYHLAINKKQYTETTFEQMRAQLERAADQADKSERSEEHRAQPEAIDESKCEWLPPKVEVRKTGEKAQLAGYDTERTVVLASQPCKDKETGAICEVALSVDEWLAAGFTQSAEAQQFYKAYAARLGLDASGSGDLSQRAQALFSQYKGLWAQVTEKLKGSKGYPLRNSFTLALGGEQCKNANEKEAQTNGAGTGSGDNSTPHSANELAGAMAGKLGSLFHKKKDDSAAPAATAVPAVPPPVLPPGDVAVMTLSSQLLSVSTATLAPDTFTVPADYKLEQSKTR